MEELLDLGAFSKVLTELKARGGAFDAADVKAKPSTASYAMEHSSMYASRRPLVPSQSAPLPALADLGAASAAREIGSATLRGSALWSGLDD